MNSFPFQVGDTAHGLEAGREADVHPATGDGLVPAWKHSPPVAPPHSMRTDPFGLSPR
jgi:hypothetical protein